MLVRKTPDDSPNVEIEHERETDDQIAQSELILDVVRGPSTPHDPESDAGGSLSSWQGHPSR
jgi:hypothetical protein